MSVKRAKVILSSEILQYKLKMRDGIEILNCEFNHENNSIEFILSSDEFDAIPEAGIAPIIDPYQIFNWCPTIQLPPEWLDRINNSTSQEPGANDED